MAYKISMLAPAQDRYVDLQGNESGKKFQSWVIEPVDTSSLDMDALDSVFGKTERENELMQHTIVTNPDDLATVVAIAKAYHDCTITVEKLVA